MSAGIDQDTYAVLRERLAGQAAELGRRAGALNEVRIAAFGSGELGLTGTGRVRTERACVPRDVVAVGDDLLLFGSYAPSTGSSETAVADVFTLYDRDLKALPEDAVPGLLDDPGFVREFSALHRYFRGARLLRLRRVEGGSSPSSGPGSRTTTSVSCAGPSIRPEGHSSWTPRASATTSSRQPTTSTGCRRPATTTSWGATRISRSTAGSSSPRSAGR